MPLELAPELLLIPVWFYSYSVVVYSASALIAFLVSLFSYKLYKMSSFKLNLILAFSFLLLGIAYSSLAVTSTYTYFYKEYFTHSFSLGLVNSVGFNVFYITSALAYLSLLLVYLPKKIKNKLFVLYVPFWYANLFNFHLLSIALLSLAAIFNIKNFYKKKNLDSFLVMFAFLTLVCFHAFLLLVPFDAMGYLAANSFLAVGFLSLLSMLVRVSRSGKKK